MSQCSQPYDNRIDTCYKSSLLLVRKYKEKINHQHVENQAINILNYNSQVELKLHITVNAPTAELEHLIN
ncbi:hypothetical protein GUJ93_ZPchr0012g18973 [Zizania palustris]|uniref:Uncharacterized protein n=1 Tax=Zizania palustris TaxID=103762 RepID=A0A8J5WTE0_ZIZPA|nr:hypothetical protein GUJ93_ZPchr0012g18973 [Zizania palustris]